MPRINPVGSHIAAASFALAALAFGNAAHALPCADLNFLHPIYGSGGSAATATIGKVAQALAGLDEPITILFADPGACTGYQAFLDNKVTTPFKYWDKDGNQLQCEPPAVVGQTVDFAHMANPASACAGITTPDDIGDFAAPVQSFNFITSVNSAQTSISAEAAYFVYGWGAQSEAAPWTVEANLAKRKSDSAAHLLIAEALGLPASKFKGVEVKDQQAVVNLVVAAAGSNPDSSLGYVSGSSADKNRATVKTLAYQHYGQSCGYWPDKDETSFDKLNVRKGQYFFWTPGHLFARLNGPGEIANPEVAEFIGWFGGTIPGPSGIDINEIVIKAGDLPTCAMQVQREGTLGAISSYSPAEPCGCFFDSVATGTTSCDPCQEGDVSTDDRVCRFGFWEAY